MAWIKITHLAGTSNINLDNVSNFESYSTDSIRFYGVDLIGFNQLTFSTVVERDEIIFKLKNYLNIPNIEDLVYA
jgi:hypothetical protein